MGTALYILFIIVSVIFYRPGEWSRRNLYFWDSYMGNEDGYDDSQSFFDKWMESHKKRKKRKNALKKAEKFLKPYKNIYGDHCLSNTYCHVNLQMTKEKTFQIFCISKVPVNNQEKALFIAEDINSDNDIMNDFWNNLCIKYTEITRYENIFEECRVKYLNVKASQIEKKENVQDSQIQRPQPKALKIIDINNATEAEIAELPGISIIIAKKIIIQRAKKPFESVDDFLTKMQIQSNFIEKLKTMVCVNEIKVLKVDQINDERIVDI